MDFNPMMLLPMLMMKKNGSNDIGKITEMMSAMNGQNNADALMNMLGVDEKTKNMLSILKNINTTSNANDSSNIETQKNCINTKPLNDDINHALNMMMHQK